MSLNDPLANALSTVLNSEKGAKAETYLKPVTTMLKKVLHILKQEGYVGEYSELDDGKGKIMKLQLLGKINNCNVVKPRFALGKGEFEKYEKRFLPARGFGVLIVSTHKGLMTHAIAKEKGLGGRLIAYCY
jgi:small subunit ribosomal protein S8